MKRSICQSINDDGSIFTTCPAAAAETSYAVMISYGVFGWVSGGSLCHCHIGDGRYKWAERMQISGHSV